MEITLKDQWPLNLTFKDVPVGSAFLTTDGSVCFKTCLGDTQGNATVLLSPDSDMWTKVGDVIVANNDMTVARIFSKMELS